ncbi:MAG: hypothetical protein FD175_1946 [Beijerinckiaceae bacterium]|nr:MAG: hypothetical protein FD175_1946 [Beijerinckiaceae bacterium]
MQSTHPEYMSIIFDFIDASQVYVDEVDTSIMPWVRAACLKRVYLSKTTQ